MGAYRKYVTCINVSLKTETEVTQILELANKDFKAAITYMLKDRKKKRSQ
jgi:hypothetical protein